MPNWYNSVKGTPHSPQHFPPFHKPQHFSREIEAKLKKIEYFINNRIEHDEMENKRVGPETVWYCLNELTKGHGVKLSQAEMHEIAQRVSEKHGFNMEAYINQNVPSDNKGLEFIDHPDGGKIVKHDTSTEKDWEEEAQGPEYTPTPSGYIFRPKEHLSQANGDAIARQAWELIKQQIPEPKNRFGKYLEYTIQHVLREQFQIPEQQIPQMAHMVKKHQVEDTYLDMPDGSQAKYPWNRQQQQQAFNG